jgi:hypothetical protein
VHSRLHAEACFGKEHVERSIHFRQRKSRAMFDLSNQETLPVSPPSPKPADPVVDLAKRALVRMGFRDTEARRALLAVRWPDTQGAPPAIQDLLKAALAVLCP